VASSKKINLGETKKSKPSPVTQILSDVFIPKTVVDAAMYAVPYGKAARVMAGITKQGSRYVSKVYRSMGN
jgi:serine/threonine-protein kinase RIO1